MILNNILAFYVHVTVLHRNKFLYNKTKQMHQFPKFTPAWNSTFFSGSSSAHHQEFIHRTLGNGIGYTSL